MPKPSLRTRVSFEAACGALGAHPIVLEGENNAFSRGESVKDTVKVLERYVDALVIRTFSDAFLAAVAAHASIPVINALTDGHHPCQGLADLLTVQEHFGKLAGLTLAYVGDGSNNMAHTYAEAGALAGMHVRIATPADYPPAAEVLDTARRIAQETGGSVEVFEDATEALAGAEVVVTDTWASMGQEAEHETRAAVFEPYRVDADLMKHAAADAIFLHCLPAHRGEEVTDEVIDSTASKVYDEAENRLHAQAALLQLVLADEEE
jgi:ornithine carbamoyltransferase